MKHTLIVELNTDISTDHFIWVIVKLSIDEGRIIGNVHGQCIHKGESYHEAIVRLNAILGASKSILMIEHGIRTEIPVTYLCSGKVSSYEDITDYLVKEGFLK